MKCPSCGATLVNGKCDYCGADLKVSCALEDYTGVLRYKGKEYKVYLDSIEAENDYVDFGYSTERLEVISNIKFTLVTM